MLANKKKIIEVKSVKRRYEKADQDEVFKAIKESNAKNGIALSLLAK